jgi:hypothetical protein
MRPNENVVNIWEYVWSHCWLTCRLLADELDMSKETVTKILAQDLGLRKLGA